MSFTVACGTLNLTTCAALESVRGLATRAGDDREYTVDINDLSNDDMADLIQAATKADDKKALRAAEAVLSARSGDFSKPVPNFKAFKETLTQYLKANILDGWIYVEHEDEFFYPELVTKITYDPGISRGAQSTPSVIIHTVSYSKKEKDEGAHKVGVTRNTHSFYPQQVARRRIDAILSAAKILHESPSLKAAHAEQIAEFHNSKLREFAEQFRLTGIPYLYEEQSYKRKGQALSGRKVIHDLDNNAFAPMRSSIESQLFDDDDQKEGVGEIPEHPLLRVYDLEMHEHVWANAGILTKHKYDKSLRDKLILPDTHRDLLDVLTTDLDAFVSDFVEGKSAGNVILCKGLPGVGKTLTAEVYSELIERPLLSIHSGTLGTSADQIERGLKEYFAMAQRWKVPMLLDEADVFVSERGLNLQHNAVVATFLRALEYYSGLLFMTTNRSKDIDDAIISRCAAIIEYHIPEADRTREIWKVMANQFQSPLSGDLIDKLLSTFPTISPRDIKMLFRLALRVASSKGDSLDIELFRRCAMFRAIEMPEKVAPSA